MTRETAQRCADAINNAISIYDQIGEILCAITETLSPSDIYEDDDTALHDWAIENGYIRKENQPEKEY